MSKAWEDNKSLVHEFNISWEEAELIRSQFESKRGKAAIQLEYIIKNMTDEAKAMNERAKINVEPVIEENKMVGLKVSIDDQVRNYRL